jgi:hypothetical protein
MKKWFIKAKENLREIILYKILRSKFMREFSKAHNAGLNCDIDEEIGTLFQKFGNLYTAIHREPLSAHRSFMMHGYLANPYEGDYPKTWEEFCTLLEEGINHRYPAKGLLRIFESPTSESYGRIAMHAQIFINWYRQRDSRLHKSLDHVLTHPGVHHSIKFLTQPQLKDTVRQNKDHDCDAMEIKGA